ncbi:MAG: excinuclease ABC subunit UvrC [Rhodospirillales bacterium]
MSGVDCIKSYLTRLPMGAGVYRMINRRGDVLYVGKAKSLRKRVASYTNLTRQSNRIRRMINETVAMEFVSTHTEAEALLLESDLIKRYAPRYNILLRDDKSFPAILVTGDHDYPQVLKHRGARKRKGQYFGPFASVWAVNETLTFLQRVFLLRTCTDSVFDSRTRPCLLFQIKRCSAPCVGRIDKEAYGVLVAQARDFLSGRSHDIQQELADKMQKASDELDFEIAAQYRDRIRALTRIQSHRGMVLSDTRPTDVIAVHQSGGQSCVQVFFFRGGNNYGNRAYYPTHAREAGAGEVLEAFIGQFYAKVQPPRRVIISIDVPNHDLLEKALCLRADHKVRITVPVRGEKRDLVDAAVVNAREALGRRMSESASQRKLLEGLAEKLALDGAPERIEVYDNSHVAGRDAVGAMIVAGPEGFMKQAYRKFTIKNAKNVAGKGEVRELADGAQRPYSAGDDYGMMREVLNRRFSRALREDPDRTSGQWPDLLLIDGGKGQLQIARDVLAELGIEDVALAAVAKGPDRNAGRETIYMPDRSPVNLMSRDPVLYFIQRLRDEAHRFAIGTHRGKRGKSTHRSALDEIPGIGAARKKALLHHFGAVSAIQQAGRRDLEAVDGISAAIAERIYGWFHPED